MGEFRSLQGSDNTIGPPGIPSQQKPSKKEKSKGKKAAGHEYVALPGDDSTAAKIPKPPPQPSASTKSTQDYKGRIKTSPTEGHFSQKIARGRDRLKLGQAAESLERTSSLLGGNVQLKGLGGSINPVTRLSEEFFVPRSEFEAASPPVDVSKANSYFEKDYVINNLRLMLGKGDESHVQQRDEILGAIRALQSERGLYVSNDKLMKIIGTFPNPEGVTKNLPKYLSSVEVLGLSDFDSKVEQKLKSVVDTSRFDKLGYAFKLGIENHREILAGNLNRLLNLNDHLLSKEEVSLKGTTLGKKENPQGIASRWLEGGQGLNIGDWSAYCNLRQQIAIKEFRGEDASVEKQQLAEYAEKIRSQDAGPREEVAELRKAIEQMRNEGKDVTAAERKLRDLEGNLQNMDPTGAWDQMLMNLTFQSYDAHPAQFMALDGQLQGFDEARFLAPSQATCRVDFINMDKEYIENDDLNKKFPSLSAALMDRPGTTDPLSKTYIQEILSRNLDEDRKAIEESGLFELSDEDKMDVWDKMQQAGRKLNLQKASEEDIKRICDKYGIKPDFNNLEATQIKIKNEMIQEMDKFTEDEKQKIPRGVINKFIQMLSKKQEYLRLCETKGTEPTMFGMNAFLYPKGVATIPTFRAALLEHPDSEVPLSNAYLDKIRKRDVDADEQALRKSGMVGSQSFFDDHETGMLQLWQDKQFLNPPTDEAVEIICNKYNIASKGIPFRQLVGNIMMKLNGEYERLQTECFQKIHPVAAKNMIDRLRLQKKYLEHCEKNDLEPTMQGMRDYLYPQYKTFLKVLQRLEKNPSDMFSFVRVKGAVRLRPLESIIADAKTQKLASDEELQQMQKDLEVLQSQACLPKQLALAMDM